MFFYLTIDKRKTCIMHIYQKVKLLFLISILFIPLSYSQVQVGDDIIGNESDLYGFSIDLSSNGQILSIGSNVGGENVGKTIVYELQDDGQWQIIGDAIEDRFIDRSSECSVRLSADGSRLVRGVPYYVNDANVSTGLVEVYDFDGNNWNQVGQPLIGNGLGDYGYAVEITNHGSRIMVRNRVYSQMEGSNTRQGRVQIYDLIDDRWIQIGGDILKDDLLWSAGLSGDGQQLTFINTEGLIEFYEFDNLSQQWEVLSTITNNVNNGRNIKYSNDQNHIVYTSLIDTANHFSVYKLNNEWERKGSSIQINDRNTVNEKIAISSDGSYVAVAGVESEESSVTGQPAIFNNYCRVYQFRNEDWQLELDYTIDLEDAFGPSDIVISDNDFVAISYSGYSAVGETNNGLVRVYDISSISSDIEEAEVVSHSIFPNPTSGFVHFKEVTKYLEVIIYDSTGKVIRRQELIDNRLDVSDLPSGTYIIRAC